MEFENQNEDLASRVQNLSYTLQQVRLEGERRMVTLQQQHEDKLHLVMRHLANESNGESEHVISRIMGKKVTMGSRTVAAAAAAAAAAANKQVGKSSSLITRITSIARHDRQLQTALPAPQAKITRRKNKLIIQQTN